MDRALRNHKKKPIFRYFVTFEEKKNTGGKVKVLAEEVGLHLGVSCIENWGKKSLLGEAEPSIKRNR